MTPQFKRIALIISLLALVMGPVPAHASSDEAVAYNQSGLASLDAGDYASAFASFTSAINADELYAEAYANRAVSLLRMERASDALTDVDEAIVLYTKGELCEDLENGGFALAEYLQNVMEELADINSEQDETAVVDFSFTSAGNNTGVSSGSSDDDTTTTTETTTTTDTTSASATSSTTDTTIEVDMTSIVPGDSGFSSTSVDVSTSGDSRRARINALNVQIAEKLTLITSCTLVSVLNQEGLSRAYYIRALALTETGDYDAAIEDFNRLIRLSPDNAMLYAGRGMAYLGQGAHNLALSDFNAALSLDPALPETQLALGEYWLFMDNYDLAMEYFQKALELSPQSAAVYSAIGRLEMDRGDYGAAIAAFTSSIHYNPLSPKTYDLRGDAWTAEAARASSAGQNDRAANATTYAAEDYARADALEETYSAASASQSDSSY